ncbi:hypothetical protein COL26b_006826 [Colletotrichum chrysophilum]|uniref:uncharacterized protein n=1 Tax=Colletotrichum chrysophilum TaxID=1836956 RepID=UPI0023007029|nr:uncharacterized protein COL26b_006826 [Colletotrichum chrysophilum]KAJ0374954.1 hypothetical protein COL26b_006826 [Colletotrichum chrysophilum]
MILPNIFTLFSAAVLNLAKAAVDWEGSRNQRFKETALQLVTGPSIRIVYKPALTTGGAQIGKGVYITPGPGQWEGNPGDWHCLITANRIAVDNTIKAWIPQNTWWKIGAQYDWASTQTVNNKKVDDEAFNRALRMSKIDKTNDAVKFAKGAKQLLIPTDLVNDRALDFQVDCKKDWKLLSDTKIVNYNGWKKNVIGKPQ